MRAAIRILVLSATLALMACGGSGGATLSPPARQGGGAHARPARIPTGDWLTFDHDSARSGVSEAATGITGRDLALLRRRQVRLDGTVDSSPVELGAIPVHGRRDDLIIVTTTYGRTIALDASTGRRMWEFTPASTSRLEGSYRITNATPVADPSRRYVYAASPDGLIHKLRLSDGQQIRSGHWPVHVTLLPSREKIASSLNLSGREVIVTTGGYIGDAPPYQGHAVTIDRSSGRILHVWNSLCAERHRLIVPSSCPVSDSAIWGRSGAVVEPGGGRLLVATGNAGSPTPFDGRRFWGDSVLELTPDAAQLLHNWTPPDQARLSASDTDIGSSSPVVLPLLGGRRLAVQGGKDGKLRLLDLLRLNGTRGPAAPRTGGELATVPTPGGDQLFTAPAVWPHRGHVVLFVADGSGTAEYVVAGGPRPSIRQVAANGSPGTSPILAGGLLYVYDPSGGSVKIYQPTGLLRLGQLPAAPGHWNSPIVAGGRVIVPEGDANEHSTQGTLDIYHLPGR